MFKPLSHERFQAAPHIDPFDIPNEHMAPPTEAHLNLLKASEELLQSSPLTVGRFFEARMEHYFNDLAEFITAGVVPRLASVKAKSDSWYSVSGTSGRRITIDVFDPDSISPEQIADLYKQLRGATNARELKERTEALAILELEMVLERALELLETSEIDLGTWEWRPEPTPLKDRWRRRAKVLGLNENTFKTRQSVSNFQKRMPFAMYCSAIVGLGKPGQRLDLLNLEIEIIPENDI